MGPSEKAFQQVRNILGKLDRNIDQLRSQRTTPPSSPATVVGREIIPAAADLVVPSSGVGRQAGTAATPPRPASIYGRATPIPPKAV